MRVRSGELLIDLGAGEVRRGEEAVEVSGLTWELLAALAEAVPEPVPTDVLAEKVWGRTHVTDQTIAQRVTMLRQALGDSGDRQQHVRTVRGRGYALRGERLRSEVAVSRFRRKRTWVVAAAGIAATTITAGAYLYQSARDVVLYDEERGSLFVGAAVGDGFDRPVRGTIGEIEVIMLGMPSAEAMAASAMGRQLLCAEEDASADLRQVLRSDRLKSRCVEAESQIQ